MRRSKIVVLVFCCIFSINSFAEMTGPQKYGLFFGGKFLLDTAAAWLQIEQMQALDEIAATLPSENCKDVCQENSEAVNNSVNNAKTALGFAVGFSVLSDFTNLAGLVRSFKGDEPKKIALATTVLSFFNFWVTLMGDVWIWGIKDYHLDGLPKETEKETDEAISKIWAPLVVTGVVGLPATAVLVIAHAPRG